MWEKRYVLKVSLRYRACKSRDRSFHSLEVCTKNAFCRLLVAAHLRPTEQSRGITTHEAQVVGQVGGTFPLKSRRQQAQSELVAVPPIHEDPARDMRRHDLDTPVTKRSTAFMHLSIPVVSSLINRPRVNQSPHQHKSNLPWQTVTVQVATQTSECGETFVCGSGDLRSPRQGLV
ncbi:hypothetical protein TKK_0015351 [Trichogramma kaykai]